MSPSECEESFKQHWFIEGSAWDFGAEVRLWVADIRLIL
jgi:hypothetical protein